MSHAMRKPVYAICEQQISLRIRTVWSAPLLFAAWIVYYLYLLYPKFQALASLISRAGQFETEQVTNAEDRFSRDEAHIMVAL